MPQVTGYIPGMSNCAVKFSTDAVSWTDISGHTNSVAPTGGDRGSGEVHTFKGDLPLVGVGKRGVVEVTARIIYSEAPDGAYTAVRDAFRNKTPCYLRIMPKGPDHLNIAFTSGKGRIVGCPPPGGAASSGEPLMVEFRHRCAGWTRGTFLEIEATDVPQSEADALIWLYNNLDGENWINDTNWLETSTVDDWSGVTVAGGHITSISFLGENGLAGDISDFPWSALPNLNTLVLCTQSGMYGDISDWTLPEGMVTFSVGPSQVEGDIGGWTFPAGLESFDVGYTNVSGDISGWELPATLTSFYIGGSGVTGDISGWTIPAAMNDFWLRETALTGSMNGWVMPQYLMEFRVNKTGLTGWPSLASSEYLYKVYCADCGWDQAQVDAVLAAIYDRRMGFAYSNSRLFIGGTNAAPSGTFHAAVPPTTGQECHYELENDSASQGYKKWIIEVSE